jgi:hypothetical protein
MSMYGSSLGECMAGGYSLTRQAVLDQLSEPEAKQYCQEAAAEAARAAIGSAMQSESTMPTHQSEIYPQIS